MKKIASIITMLLVFVSLTLTAFAQTQDDTSAAAPAPTQAVTEAVPSLQDNANLLSKAQKAVLEEKIEAIEDSCNIRLAILTVKSIPDGMSAKAFADGYLNKNYRDEANNEGSIILMIATSTRDWYISTDNNMRRIITDDAGLDYLSSSFLSSLSDDDYYTAFDIYTDTVYELCYYYWENEEPYDPGNEFSWISLICGLGLSALLAWMYVSYLEGQMSNIRPVNEASEYLERDSVKLDTSKDIYLYTDKVYTKRSDNDSDSPSVGGSNGGGGGNY